MVKNASNEEVNRYMIPIICYLCLWVFVLAVLWCVGIAGYLPSCLEQYNIAYNCALISGLGGVIYCLKAVYYNRSVRNCWTENWNVWYFLRPLVSVLMGLIAYVFLKAGLLVLDAENSQQSNPYGFWAFSFLAGLNVDRFLMKLEEIGKSVWGIKPSRTSEQSNDSERKKNETDNS